MSASGPVPMCPVRPGDACSLCQPGASGPESCGLVWLVMQDPELRDELARRRHETAAVPRTLAGATPTH